MIRRPPRSTQSRSSAASDVYKRQHPRGMINRARSVKLFHFLKRRLWIWIPGKTLGVNQRGELCVRGPMIMSGYVNNPEATNALIDKDGWLHSGDIAYWDEDEHFFIVDRLKSLIKYKGYQVAPAELESILLQHPNIFDAGVAGLPDDDAGELPAAVVVLEHGKTMTEKEIVDYVASQVTTAKKLRGGVVFVDEVAKGLTGKLDARKIREILIKAKKGGKSKL